MGSPGTNPEVIKQLTKRAIERIMNAEMDCRLDSEENRESGREAGNCRSGKGHKIIKGDFGEAAIETPRGRKSTFEPRIVPKRQHRVEIIDKAIMALYAKGMTVRDIQSTIKGLYSADVSPTLVSEVAGAMKDEAREMAK